MVFQIAKAKYLNGDKCCNVAIMKTPSRPKELESSGARMTSMSSKDWRMESLVEVSETLRSCRKNRLLSQVAELKLV